MSINSSTIISQDYYIAQITSISGSILLGDGYSEASKSYTFTEDVPAALVSLNTSGVIYWGSELYLNNIKILSNNGSYNLSAKRGDTLKMVYHRDNRGGSENCSVTATFVVVGTKKK